MKCIWIGLHSSSIIHVWSLSDTLHSSRVESIGTSIIHVWSLWYSSLISSGEYWNINNPRLITLQYSSRVESIVTWSAVGFWQWSSSRHYKLIWTLLHCLYLFILMSSMFSNLLIIMIGSISSVYEYCLSAGYGQFHTFIPSVLLIFYISGANTSFTGNTILHNTDSNLCLNYFIELLIYIMRFSHCVCS